MTDTLAIWATVIYATLFALLLVAFGALLTLRSILREQRRERGEP